MTVNMNKGLLRMGIGLATVLLVAGDVRAEDMGTVFTYQGRLSDAGSPVDGTVDVKFTLYDAATAGNVVGSTAVFDGQAGNGAEVEVTAGLMIVEPDFGVDVFDGTALWLEIEVRNPHDAGDTGAYETLDPRQPIRPAPYALALRGIRTKSDAGSLVPGGSWNIIAGHANNSIDPDQTLGGATISGGGSQLMPNTVGSSAAHGTVGGGEGNTCDASKGTIGGGLANTVDGVYSTVAGGGWNTANNWYASVPGGSSNLAGGWYSFAAGRNAKIRDGDSGSTYYSGNSRGDEGTFIWADSTDEDFISTGPDQFLIRAAGGAGIGTASPTPGNQLTVAGDADFSGNVGIGTTSPETLLHVGTGNGALLRLGNDPELTFTKDTVTDRFTISVGGSGWTNAEILQIGRGTNDQHVVMPGKVGIGADTMPDVALDVVGSITYTGTISDVSDERLKENIAPVRDALTKLLQLRGVYFNMKDNPDVREVGLIAQNVQSVLPEAVSVIDLETGHLGVSYPSLTPLTVEAIKELHAIVKDRDAEIDALQTDMAMLKETVGQMSSSTGTTALGVATPALAALCLVGFLAMGRVRKGGAR